MKSLLWFIWFKHNHLRKLIKSLRAPHYSLDFDSSTQMIVEGSKRLKNCCYSLAPFTQVLSGLPKKVTKNHTVLGK